MVGTPCRVDRDCSLPMATRQGLLVHRSVARFLLGFFPTRLVQVTVETEIFSSEALGQQNDLIGVPGKMLTTWKMAESTVVSSP